MKGIGRPTLPVKMVDAPKEELNIPEDAKSWPGEDPEATVEIVPEPEGRIPANASITVAAGMHPRSMKFLENHAKVRELHFKKGEDYGTKEDPFFNITDGAEDFGIPPWKSAAKSANDCLVRIRKYARDGQLANESVEDAFLDLANYSLIALTLWQEEE